MSLQHLKVVLDGLHFPENLRWHEDALFFSDMYGDRVHRYDPATETSITVGDLYHPAGLGWLPDGRLLAVASEDRKIFSIEHAGNELYADLTSRVHAWANDMLIEPDGRIVVGNFGYDLFNEPTRETHLTIVESDRTTHRGPGGLRFPNGMVTRSDGALIVAETFGARLSIYDRDGASLRAAGHIALEPSMTPDGLCIDAEDGIWLASPTTSEVVYVTTAGQITRHPVGLPPYACMLGGANRQTLFVATAPDHEPADRRRAREGRIQATPVAIPGVGGDGLGERASRRRHSSSFGTDTSCETPS